MPTTGIPSTTATDARPAEAQGRIVRRQGLLIVLLGLSILAGFWSLASGVAALAAWQAGLVSEAALGRTAALNGPQDRLVRQRLALARRLDPRDPHHAELLARHLEGMAGQYPPRSAAQRPLLEEARALRLASTARRPTWPYGLTGVLHTDFALGRFGPEFNRCYVRAVQVGRSETQSRRSLVALGLGAWPALAPQTRELVMTLVRHELILDPHQLIEVALRLGRGALVEPLIGDDPELARLYTDLSARAGASR